MTFSATYSPDDNKLRLYSVSRLDPETYARVKAAGFKWAPKQGLFVAPTWTPARADLLIELCGEIGDEDSTLVDRAEDRADRFEEYSEKRLAEANRARDAVDQIAERFAFGQPILVGHHSEKSARKDKERMDNGMRKALKLWDTSNYWTARAHGAIRAAKYKERADVRHRRIKTLEAERRKVERSKSEAAAWLKLWAKCGEETDAERQHQIALAIANRCWLHLPRKEGDREDWPHSQTAYGALSERESTLYAPRTVAEVIEHAKAVYPATIANCDRWLSHYDNRLAYERAMLAEQIGVDGPDAPASLGERFAFQVGGKVQIARERSGAWLTIIRVNRVGGTVNSLTTTSPPGVTWASKWKYGVEEVCGYRAPKGGDAEKVKTASQLAPLCNYPGEGFHRMTAEEYKKKHKDYKCTKLVKATDQTGMHRVRHAMLKDYKTAHVFITDAKRVDPPKIVPPSEPAEPAAFVVEFVAPPTAANPLDAAFTLVSEIMAEPAPAEDSAPSVPAPEIAIAPALPDTADLPAPSPTADFEAMRAVLRGGGVQVVVAPQLFETPPNLAADVVELAEISEHHSVLEPSAGTGRLVQAVKAAISARVELIAVEINPKLANLLRSHGTKTHCGDFLECSPIHLGRFDRIVMNSPFERGADIQHIEHARTFLRPGGRLVAICADGPRQRARLEPIATEYRPLPAGSFKAAGTMVNTALVVIDGPPE
ncbi:DUF3560 domain-containing protein [Bradyrhizobium sp. Leo170]|uniref:DUF3560 domain-containing protein n=1 Tax=Bradyrhizobium sp. Leo170 TaxID=1571199 RepID=UPI00102E5F6D|nr:DUF3560 domain-containing protein [Bradyrhizobium sp. Leo170]TAI67595.1 methyltransferase type 11 [Bradyrhizobium sp. Leo170]